MTSGRTTFALTIEEIHDLVERFGDAAVRCKKAGFEIIEIHGAAGCIPTNFLSPHDNMQGKGVSADQISIVSYGKEKPAVLGHDEAAYSKNRRAVLVY